MKDPLKALTIAVTGDFGTARTNDKIRQWVQVNGGTFSYDVTLNVTHLICSNEHFRKGSKMVKTARQLRGIKIVSFDWLEDSLLATRRCSERKYLMSANAQARKDIQKKEKAIREQNVKKGLEVFEKTCVEFEKEIYASDYSIYYDHTNYKYDITLVRVNLRTNTNERHAIKLYESNATPKLYACFERHNKPGEGPTASILAPIGSSFHVALDHFKQFFCLKTGKEWDDRYEKSKTAKNAFMFATPKPGEARGVMNNDGLLMEAVQGVAELQMEKCEPSGDNVKFEASVEDHNGDKILDMVTETREGEKWD